MRRRSCSIRQGGVRGVPTVAVVQMQPRPDDVPANRAATIAAVARAAAQGADLVVLPEMCTTGYAFSSATALAAQAEFLTASPTVLAWQELTAGLGISIVGGLA